MKPDLDKCTNGHFRTEATLYINPKTKRTYCRLCRKDSQKKASELLKSTSKRNPPEVRVFMDQLT